MDVNALDNDNWTPLHAASHWGHEKAAKILADHGADFDKKSKLVSLNSIISCYYLLEKD